MIERLSRNIAPATGRGQARRGFLVFLAALLLALTACTGRLPGPEGWSAGSVVGDALYIGSMEGVLLALDRANGQTIESIDLNGDDPNPGLYGRPTISDDMMFVGDYAGVLHALNLEGNRVWQEPVGGRIVGSPVVADGVVLVGSSDHALYAFNAADGSRLWRFETGGMVWSTPVVADGNVYFGSLDHKLYALRLQDGGKLWEFNTNGGITAAPVVADGRVYVGSFDSVFHALDAQTGAEVWRFADARGWFWAGAVATQDTIYAPSLDGNLYALDMATGRLRWSLKTNGPIVGSPVVVFDRVVVGSDDGTVRLVRLSDGGDEFRCNIGSQIRASLTKYEAPEGTLVYLAARDHSIRALRVKPNGSPDEIWVHFTNREDAVPVGRTPAC